ncbi:MAG: hypothetical protein IJF76_03845 [Clostridia bacterium]|nr:hypothetical protein [Clostridia bacterium]
MQEKNSKRTKIWLRTVDGDEKILKEKVYEYTGDTMPAFLEELRRVCEELDEATPVVLRSHYNNFKQFNVVRFAPRDFVEYVYFEKMILEYVK